MADTASERRCFTEQARLSRLHIVTGDAPLLVARLRTDYAAKRGVRLTVLQTLRSLVEVALAQRPDVVILSPSGASASEMRRVAGGLRSRLPTARILLAIPQDQHSDDEDLVVYDGLVSLAELDHDLAVVLTPLLERPGRSAARITVPIPAELRLRDGRTLAGMTVDVSETGAGLELRSRGDVAALRNVRFHRADGREAVLDCELAWEFRRSGPGCRVGVVFTNAALAALRALRDLAFWRLVTAPEGDVVHLHGSLTSVTRFTSLTAAVLSTPRLDLSGLTEATPPGLVRWHDFLHGLPSNVTLRLRRVPSPLAQWFAALPAMTRNCMVESHFVATLCMGCEREGRALAPAHGDFTPGACPFCRGEVRVITCDASAWRTAAANLPAGNAVRG